MLEELPRPFCEASSLLQKTFRLGGEKKLVQDVPKATTFFQLEKPQKSSRVSCRPPGPMTEIQRAAQFSQDQLRSGASPSVLLTPLVKLNEKGAWHA